MFPRLAKLVNRPQDVAENEAGTNRKRFKFLSSGIMFDHFSKFSIRNLILEESSSKRKMKMKNLKNEAIPSFESDKNSFKKVCNGGIRNFLLHRS